jgi:hypothetical protein
MPDSEISTSLPFVTRRTVLAGGGGVTALLWLPLTPPQSPVNEDPILNLWRDWQRAYFEGAAWSKMAGSLEHAMARKVGFPRVLIASLSHGEVWATSHSEIDAGLEGIAVTDEQRHQFHSDLAAQQERWNAASEETGFNAADQNEAHAWRKSEELADALFAIRSRDILGVIIKLTLILRSGEAEVSPEEHPWPQIRSVYDDLRSLAGIDDLTA